MGLGPKRSAFKTSFLASATNWSALEACGAKLLIAAGGSAPGHP